MSGREGQAHALSLHLFSILDRLHDPEANAGEVLRDLEKYLIESSLQGDLTPVLVSGEEVNIVLTPVTPMGDAVLLELFARCEFFPCPDGECEYTPTSFCRWCGKLKK